MDLDQARERLKQVDYKILDLVWKRMELAKELTLWKLEHGVAIVQPQQEADVIADRLIKAQEIGISADFTTKLLRSIMDESVAVQRRVWQMTPPPQKRILTGIRPTGALHLGHYAGALETWLQLEDDYECFFLIADYQALGDHLSEIERIRDSVVQVALDWLAVGLDPHKSAFVIQSYIPEHAELTLLLSMLTPKSELDRNPTLKSEMENIEKTGETISVGFYTYPMSQVADILLPKGELVPVGEDQSPHIEMTRRVARRFNRIYGKRVFPVPQLKVGRVPRLVGIDGKDKMGKGLGNSIELGDPPEVVRAKVMRMFTDTKRIHATDPGTVEGNPVFIYHDAFNPNKEEVEHLKELYKAGKVGDVEVKERLVRALNNFLDPIRDRRAYFEARPQLVAEALAAGTAKAKRIAEETMREVREAMRITRYGET